MTQLPRSRSLILLDGPRHIMPIEPVTPPDSSAWRFLHRPITLTAISVVLLGVAAIALDLLGLGLRLVAGVPGVRYLAPLVGTAAVVALYWLFVRTVERRRQVDELDRDGWLAELVIGGGGGLALSLATFAILLLLGGVGVAGLNPLRSFPLQALVALCAAVVLELVVCGLAFRLVERWIGSWLALLALVAAFGLASLATGDGTASAPLAAMLQGALLFAVPYMVTRRLWAAIGFTAAWKFTQFALYGVVTPGGPPGFVRTYLIGPDWLTGGRAGPDASIPALCAGGLLAVVLAAVAIRRGRIVRPARARRRRPS